MGWLCSAATAQWIFRLALPLSPLLAVAGLVLTGELMSEGIAAPVEQGMGTDVHEEVQLPLVNVGPERGRKPSWCGATLLARALPNTPLPRNLPGWFPLRLTRTRTLLSLAPAVLENCSRGESCWTSHLGPTGPDGGDGAIEEMGAPTMT